VNDHEQLVAKADEYAKRVGRVGDPQMRPALEAYAKIAYLQGLQDGIRHEREVRAEVSRG
jgi:hypothetical protein